MEFNQNYQNMIYIKILIPDLGRHFSGLLQMKDPKFEQPTLVLQLETLPKNLANVGQNLDPLSSRNTKLKPKKIGKDTSMQNKIFNKCSKMRKMVCIYFVY